MNHDRIALRIQSHIDADPWSITVYQPGDQPGIDNEVRYTFTGRIYPAGTKGESIIIAVPYGRARHGDYVWLCCSRRHPCLRQRHAAGRPRGEQSGDLLPGTLFDAAA